MEPSKRNRVDDDGRRRALLDRGGPWCRPRWPPCPTACGRQRRHHLSPAQEADRLARGDRGHAGGCCLRGHLPHPGRSHGQHGTLLHLVDFDPGPGVRLGHDPAHQARLRGDPEDYYEHSRRAPLHPALVSGLPSWVPVPSGIVSVRGVEVPCLEGRI